MNRISPCSEEVWAPFRELLTRRALKKGDVLLAEGQVCTHNLFLNRGLVRAYSQQADGTQTTWQLHLENSFAVVYDSFVTGRPSRLALEALEDGEAVAFAARDLDALYRAWPQWERIGRLIAEKAYVGTADRAFWLLRETPEQRYQRLLRDKPTLLERVPQYYLASYLGIRPQSLSRIRARLAQPARRK